MAIKESGEKGTETDMNGERKAGIEEERQAETHTEMEGERSDSRD